MLMTIAFGVLYAFLLIVNSYFIYKDIQKTKELCKEIENANAIIAKHKRNHLRLIK